MESVESGLMPGIGDAVPPWIAGAGYSEDAEIQAIRGCMAQLNQLQSPVRKRVLRYLTDRFGE